MTANELLQASYAWSDVNAQLVLGASVILPVSGTALAWIGKGGRTDADGRFVASTVMAIALLGVLVEIAGIFLARSVLGISLLEANAALLVAPVLFLAVAIAGIRLVFPLSELGSVRTALDLGAFLFAGAIALWLLSKFRGWGVVFFGSVFQLIAVFALGGFFLSRLYRRAFFGRGREEPRAASENRPVLVRRGGVPETVLSAGLAASVVGLTIGALVMLGRSAPASSRPAAMSGATSASGSTMVTFVDDEGVQHVVGSMAEVPEKYAARAKAIP